MIVHVVFVVDRVALGQVFPDKFSFFLLILIASVLHNHLSTGSGTIGPIEVAVPRTLPHPTPRNKRGK
jgi:hypothetical protein